MEESEEVINNILNEKVLFRNDQTNASSNLKIVKNRSWNRAKRQVRTIGYNTIILAI